MKEIPGSELLEVDIVGGESPGISTVGYALILRIE
jgi:hypothetical protein